MPGLQDIADQFHRPPVGAVPAQGDVLSPGLGQLDNVAGAAQGKTAAAIELLGRR
jgi:hypothetical protein